MMKIFLSLLLCIPMIASAAPFLVSDPAPAGSTATHCVYQDGTAAAVVTPLVSRACRADLAGMSVGSHSLQVWFRDDVWGTESAKIPFVFTRPAAGGTGPAGVGIEK